MLFTTLNGDQYIIPIIFSDYTDYNSFYNYLY